MRSAKIGYFLAGIVVGLLLIGAADRPSERVAPSAISGEEFVQALATQRTSLIDFYLSERFNPNARAAQDRPLLLAATLQRDRDTVRRLLDAGASVDLADNTGLTPLMAAAIQGDLEMLPAFVGRVTNIAAIDRRGRTALHYAILAQKPEVVELLLRMMPDLGPHSSTLLAASFEGGNKAITETVLQHIPILPEWSSSTRRLLTAALASGNQEQIRLLLKKHATPPTLEGSNTPLLADALVRNDSTAFYNLLIGGTDPNAVLPEHCSREFLDVLPSKFLRSYIEGDKGVTMLMLAAALGQPDYVRALIDAGANRNRSTVKYKMLPLYFAARTDSWRCTQLLLGSGPPPDRLRIEISLALQHIAVIKDGVPVFNTVCSTGREGYSTRTGSFVITDKERSHRSTIYKVEMPYFMRLSCLDFGMHEGVVPTYPASHGCIRMPGDAARKLFAEIPIGTLVTVK
jgi:ankyrin repeat protein